MTETSLSVCPMYRFSHAQPTKQRTSPFLEFSPSKEMKKLILKEEGDQMQRMKCDLQEKTSKRPRLQMQKSHFPYLNSTSLVKKGRS